MVYWVRIEMALAKQGTDVAKHDADVLAQLEKKGLFLTWNVLQSLCSKCISPLFLCLF